MKTYTLNDIAKLKNATVNEIKEYLKTARGYVLNKTPDLPLSPSEIKLIDPILFFNLQHPTPKVKKKKDDTDVQSIQEGQNEIEDAPTTLPNHDHSQKSIDTSKPKLEEKLVLSVASSNVVRGMKIAKASKRFNLSSVEIKQILEKAGLFSKEMLVQGDGIRFNHQYQLTDEQYDLLKASAKPPVARTLPYDDVLFAANEYPVYIGYVLFYDHKKNDKGL